MLRHSRDSLIRFRAAVPFLLCLLAAAAVVAYLLAATDLPREAVYMAGIFVLAALLWVTEGLPLFATALLVIGLQIVFLANPGNWPGLGFEEAPSPDFREIIAVAADPVIILFFGGFLLAQAAIKEGVDKAMATLILRAFGEEPVKVMLGLMLVTAFFSMWMSNTATTAMMITLVVPMLAQLPADQPLRKGLVLAVPFAANIGGMGTPIGSPPNAVGLGFLRNAGFTVGFLEWMVVAVPLMIGLLLLTWVLLTAFYKVRVRGIRIQPLPEPISNRGWFVVVVFAVTVLLWLTDALHGLPAAVVALLPAIAFTATELLNRYDVNSLEWNILILIAGGISLGMGMQMTGLDHVLIGLLPDAGGAVLASLVIATFLLSTFMSNTAAANLLLPIGISFALALPAADGSIAIQIAMSIALVASVSMALPISTPPNAIAYARGEIGTMDMVKVGSIVGILATILIILFSGPVVRLWGL